MWPVGEIDRSRRRRNTREGWAAEEGERRVTWDGRCPHHPHRPVKHQAESALLYAGWQHENESRHQQVHQIRTTLLTTIISILIISVCTQNGDELWSDIWQLLPRCKAVFLPTCFICKCVSACTLSLSISVCVALVPDYDDTHTHTHTLVTFIFLTLLLSVALTCFFFTKQCHQFSKGWTFISSLSRLSRVWNIKHDCLV